MRLEFRILWFENQPQDVRTQIEIVEEHISDVGFVPVIEMHPNGDKLPDLSTQQQLFHDFDLVVVDYDLGQPGREGDTVAQEVRRGFGFTDIVFYSGHRTIDLRAKIHGKQIDGVYCIERRRLAERLGVHIDQAVQRLSRLEAMRGLSMSTVGICDDELRALLHIAHESLDGDGQATLTAELDQLVANGMQVQGQRYSECKSFGDRLASRAVTSFHLQKLALAFTKGKTGLADLRKVLARYNDEVLVPRNTLGHAIEVRGEGGWEVSSPPHEVPITQARFPDLRKALSAHLANIAAIKAALQSR